MFSVSSLLSSKFLKKKILFVSVMNNMTKGHSRKKEFSLVYILKGLHPQYQALHGNNWQDQEASRSHFICTLETRDENRKYSEDINSKAQLPPLRLYLINIP